MTLDFRMSSTCLFSDIVLPTATGYEKRRYEHLGYASFIHPLSAAVDPAWEAKSDREIYKEIANVFQRFCVGHLDAETDVVFCLCSMILRVSCPSPSMWLTGIRASTI